MITEKINLKALKHSMMTTPKGALAIVIPVEANNLYDGEKGLYLDIVGFEINKPFEGQKDTHILKQSFSKEKREEMGEDKIKAIPILGNARVGDVGHAPTSNDQNNGKVAASADDLPF